MCPLRRHHVATMASFHRCTPALLHNSSAHLLVVLACPWAIPPPRIRDRHRVALVSILGSLRGDWGSIWGRFQVESGSSVGRRGSILGRSWVECGSIYGRCGVDPGSTSAIPYPCHLRRPARQPTFDPRQLRGPLRSSPTMRHGAACASGRRPPPEPPAAPASPRRRAGAPRWAGHRGGRERNAAET